MSHVRREAFIDSIDPVKIHATGRGFRSAAPFAVEDW